MTEPARRLPPRWRGTSRQQHNRNPDPYGYCPGYAPHSYLHVARLGLVFRTGNILRGHRTELVARSQFRREHLGKCGQQPVRPAHFRTRW